MRPTARARLAGALLFLAAPAAGAQALPRPGGGGGGTAWWGGAGLGLGTAGAGVALDLSRQSERRMWRLRFGAYTNELGATSARDAASFAEAALEAGGGRWGPGGNWAALSGGAAIVSGTKRGESFSTVGLTGTAQLISRRVPNVSVAAIANLNPEVPFVGATGSLLLGRMPWNAAR